MPNYSKAVTSEKRSGREIKLKKTLEGGERDMGTIFTKTWITIVKEMHKIKRDRHVGRQRERGRTHRAA